VVWGGGGGIGVVILVVCDGIGGCVVPDVGDVVVDVINTHGFVTVVVVMVLLTVVRLVVVLVVIVLLVVYDNGGGGVGCTWGRCGVAVAVHIRYVVRVASGGVVVVSCVGVSVDAIVACVVDVGGATVAVVLVLLLSWQCDCWCCRG